MVACIMSCKVVYTVDLLCALHAVVRLWKAPSLPVFSSHARSMA